ncbi:MAG: hypothetical protein DWQ02_07645, partial [Bacteroidetes bacterium]
MYKSKLIKLLSLLTPEESRMFYKFIRSVFYQNNANVVRLYEYLRKYYPDFPEKKLQKELVFEKLFPGRTYSLNTLAALMSKMVRLLQEFLLILDLRSDQFEREKRLVRIYGQRNQYDLFEKGTRELLDQLVSSETPSLINTIALNHQLYFHPLHNKYDPEDDSLENLMDALDQYFVLEKMRYGIALMSKQKILTHPYKWKLMEAVREGSSDIISPILFQLYTIAFALLEEKRSVNFKSFEKLFFEHIQDLDNRDKSLLYFTGLNYANGQVNAGKTAFSPIALKWYQDGLTNNLLLDNQKMDETTFGNIVTYGCREKEYAWTKNFISFYQVLLEDETREAVVTYNLALLHFSLQEFDKALAILNNYSFPEKDQPKARLTIIRTLFELFLKDQDYYDVLISNIRSFEMVISRNSFFE